MSIPFPTDDVLDNVHGLAQSVWDIRRLVSWIRRQDDSPVGLAGVSLGGYAAALAAALEHGLRRCDRGSTDLRLPGALRPQLPERSATAHAGTPGARAGAPPRRVAPRDGVAGARQSDASSSAVLPMAWRIRCARCCPCGTTGDGRRRCGTRAATSGTCAPRRPPASYATLSSGVGSLSPPTQHLTRFRHRPTPLGRYPERSAQVLADSRSGQPPVRWPRPVGPKGGHSTVDNYGLLARTGRLSLLRSAGVAQRSGLECLQGGGRGFETLSAHRGGRWRIIGRSATDSTTGRSESVVPRAGQFPSPGRRLFIDARFEQTNSRVHFVAHEPTRKTRRCQTPRRAPAILITR